MSTTPGDSSTPASPPHRVYVRGVGVVSPAGWGREPFEQALTGGKELSVQEWPTKDGRPARPVRRVPPPVTRPAFLSHPRLRRSSLVSQFAVASALEALGSPAPGSNRLGIVCTVMTGGVNYSRRFFQEVIEAPSTASPLLFPETVFNAPASHLSAVLGCGGRNDTLIGDQTAFVEGLALAAGWLAAGELHHCLVVGTEEADWLTAEALALFDRRAIPAEGAGAICLSNEPSGVELTAISDPVPYVHGLSPEAAKRQARSQLDIAGPGEVDLESGAGGPGTLRHCLGEGFAAAGAWSCIQGIQTLQRGTARRAVVTLTGSNHQAVAVQFATADFPLRP